MLHLFIVILHSLGSNCVHASGQGPWSSSSSHETLDAYVTVNNFFFNLLYCFNGNKIRYNPDESSCNHLLAGKWLLLAGYELQLKLLNTWHFLSVGNTNVRKTLVLRLSVKTVFLYLYTSLGKEIPRFHFCFTQSICLSWGKYPPKMGTPPQGFQALTRRSGNSATFPVSSPDAGSLELWGCCWNLDFQILGSMAETLRTIEPTADWQTGNEPVYYILFLLKWKTNRRVVFLGNYLPAIALVG